MGHAPARVDPAMCDRKLKDPFVRYILTTFTYGTNLGPAQAARHIAGVSAHELATTSARHVTIGKLNKAIADVVDAFTELDLIKVWGDGSVVAADGTQVDTFIDNLLAEASIRYGGTGTPAVHCDVDGSWLSRVGMRACRVRRTASSV
jgi:hypothetical protein